MIGMVKGTIILKYDQSFLLDVSGIGYKVFVPSQVLLQNTLGALVTVYTHTHVREDVLELYGFTEPADLQLFEMLIGVSGIGCKTALGVFTVGKRSDITQAITAGDVQFFQAVPRLGKKNAQKIIIELRNKLGGGEDMLVTDATDEKATADIIEALKGFGFSNKEAYDALRAVGADGTTTSEKIKLALRHLGK